MSAGPIDVERDGVREQGQISILYYDTNDVLHSFRLGKNKVLGYTNSGKVS